MPDKTDMPGGYPGEDPANAARVRKDTDPVAECECCEYLAPLTEYNNFTPEAEGPFRFCDVCANTFLNRCVTYPRQYGDQQPLWTSIGYIANMILDEIRKR